MSDLHRELRASDRSSLPPRVEADVVVLAGDIDTGVHGIHWARSAFADRPVVYVAGNHEFYGGHWTKTLDAMRAAAAGSNVHFLEDDALVVEGVRFLGASLWTDFLLFGADRKFDSIRIAGDGMNDYQRIKFTQPPTTPGMSHAALRTRKLLPDDTRSRFRTSLAFLERELAQPFARKTVVVTHHLPHRNSLAPIYQTDPISAAYASDLSALIERAQPALWLHGHTHDSADYWIGATRVVCNPRGYLDRGGADENRAFERDLVIDV